MQPVLILGYVFSLNTREVSDPEAIEVLPFRGRDRGKRGLSRPETFDKMQIGELWIDDGGVWLRDDFDAAEPIKVAETPRDFSFDGPNDNYAVKWWAKSDDLWRSALVTVELQDGAEAKIMVFKQGGNVRTRITADSEELSMDEARYVVKVAADLAPLQ